MQFYIYIFFFIHLYFKYIRSPALAKVYLFFFFWFFEKIFSWRSTRSRSSRLIRERRKSKSALRRRSLETFAASTSTGVKKVPYNLSLNLQTWRWTVLSLSSLLNFFLSPRMHKYHNRSRFTLVVYECVMCARVPFSLYILLFSFENGDQRNAVFRFVRFASQSSALERDSAALSIREIQRSSLWNFVLTESCNALCRIFSFFFLLLFFPRNVPQR